MKYSLIILLLHSSLVYTKDCPEESGKYGKEKGYQNFNCIIMIKADQSGSDSGRSVLFTNSGLIQVFNNFPGTKLSNSTGARVYYLFPLRKDKKINSVDESHITVTHPSDVQFKFDKNGKLSSLKT